MSNINIEPGAAEAPVRTIWACAFRPNAVWELGVTLHRTQREALEHHIGCLRPEERERMHQLLATNTPDDIVSEHFWDAFDEATGNELTIEELALPSPAAA